jgi:hypothetical protein
MARAPVCHAEKPAMLGSLAAENPATTPPNKLLIES